MAKSNGQPGAVVAYASIPATYEGSVTSVSALGVQIATRAYGKQTTVDRFFAAKDIVAHSDIGEGFVVVNESRPVASHHGDVIVDDDAIVITLENGRTLSYLPTTEAVSIQVHFDSEDGKQTSTEANIARRNSSKLVTAISRLEERNGGSSKKTKKAKKK